MRRRVLLFALLTVVAPLVAGKCFVGSNGIIVVSPGALVGDPSFIVEVEINEIAVSFDPNTGVTLNLEPIVLTGPGPNYTVTLNPGFPLQDENDLIVTGTRISDGKTLRSGRAFTYAPAVARARVITDPGDLITGPLAHSKLGDYLLENDEVRFIIQDAPQRDLYSVGAFGGNIIDAEWVGKPGLDNFIEVQSMLNIETVLNATSITIVNDGQDGTAAQILVCGPDDLLDFVNPSSQVADVGLPFPALADDRDLEITACTTYSLEPGDRYVKIETEVMNNQVAGMLPPATPADLPLFVGDWMNQGGELDAWITPTDGIGTGLLGELGLMAFTGFDEAFGVDYSFTTTEVPSIPGVPSNYFSISGVTVVLHNMDILSALTGGVPPFVVPLGGSLTYTRYFGVGDGSGSNAADIENEIKGVATGTVEGCVSVAGTPLAGAKVSVGKLINSFTAIDRIAQSFTTKSGACPNYSGTLAAGFWGAAAAATGHLYVGGSDPPPISVLVTTVGATSVLNFDLPAAGTVNVTVTDESGSAVPARVTVVGFDPSPEPTIAGPSFPGLGGGDLGIFNDVGDEKPFGVARAIYTDSAGSASFAMEPGSYEIFVSRGSEYSLYSSPLTVVGGSPTNVAAQIGRVIETPGFVSSDFHVHGIHSADSRVTHAKRVRQFAGEGVENVVMTDHHVHTDLVPTITSLGFGSFLTSTIGEEITSFDYGHWNAYPMTIDPSLPSGGSTDWAQMAQAGMDFPSFGAFNATPSAMYTLATTGARSTAQTVVQVNHIDSHFEPLQIDTSGVAPIVDGLDAAERAARRLPVGPNLYQKFDALELWNGDNRGDQNQFLNERIGIWMNHLNRGEPITFIADTDTHSFTNLNSAGARTWTASPTGDAPGAISSGDVGNAIAGGKGVGGQGIYVQTRLLATDGSGDVADLTAGGDTTMTDADGDVDLEIVVQAPAWAEYDTIEIYANATTVPLDVLEPYLFDATPTLVHTGGVDFTVGTTNVFPAVPGATRFETTHSVSFTGLTEDTWFVVVVKGTDGVSEPMFPVYPDSLDQAGNTTLANLLDGNIGEDGVLALGATNAVFFTPTP